MRFPKRGLIALTLCVIFTWSFLGGAFSPHCFAFEKRERFDLFCPDIPVVEAVLVAAFQAREQVVFLERPVGTVSIRRDGVTFTQALDLILADSGLSWWEKDSIYYIGEPPADTQAFARLSEAERVILSHRESKEIASLLPPLDAQVRAETPASLLVYGPPRAREQAVRSISELDLPREHISMAVLVVEVDEDEASDLTAAFSANDIGIPFGEVETIGGRFERLNRLEAVMRALETAGRSTVKARYDLTVLEGEEAMAWVGNDLYYRLETDTPAGVTVSVEQVEVGTGVRVVPRRSGEDEITVEVEVTSQDLRPTPAYPVVVSRDMETSARVREGELALLGGLTWLERHDRGPVVFQADTPPQPHGKDVTSGELLVFVQAEPSDPAFLPPVAMVRGEDAYVESISRRETISEFEASALLVAGRVQTPEGTISSSFWLGVEFSAYFGSEVDLRGSIIKGWDDNQWLGEIELSATFNDGLRAGVGFQGASGDWNASVISAYLEERRELDDNLEGIFRLGFATGGDVSLSFLSAALHYQEKDFSLTAGVRYQWAREESNWWVEAEGRYHASDRVFVFAGYRDIVAGRPIQPYDSLGFRGVYLGVGFRF